MVALLQPQPGRDVPARPSAGAGAPGEELVWGGEGSSHFGSLGGASSSQMGDMRSLLQPYSI